MVKFAFPWRLYWIFLIKEEVDALSWWSWENTVGKCKKKKHNIQSKKHLLVELVFMSYLQWYKYMFALVGTFGGSWGRWTGLPQPPLSRCRIGLLESPLNCLSLKHKINVQVPIIQNHYTIQHCLTLKMYQMYCYWSGVSWSSSLHRHYFSQLGRFQHNREINNSTHSVNFSVTCFFPRCTRQSKSD